MAAHSLAVPDRSGSEGYDFHVMPLPPVHISYFSHKDIMLSLWECGYVELTDLQTRLGPGKDKVVDPVVRCLHQDPIDAQDSWTYKQGVPFNADHDSLSFALLQSSETRDRVTLVKVPNGARSSSRLDVDLPGHSGRLVHGDGQVSWQSSKGEIFSSEC